MTKNNSDTELPKKIRYAILDGAESSDWQDSALLTSKYWEMPLNFIIGNIEDLIETERQALLTEIAEKGPKDLGTTKEESDADYFYGLGNDQCNKEWRTLLKELMEGKE